MIEFTGNLRGSMNRRSEAEIAQEGPKMEIGPNTSVLHVIGSERYHLYKQCKKLEEEEGWDESRSMPERFALGRLLREMNALNRKVQQNEVHPALKLNETGKLELCTECDERRNKSTPKDPFADR